MVATETSESGLHWVRPVPNRKYTEETNGQGEPLFELVCEAGPNDWEFIIRLFKLETRMRVRTVREGVGMADVMMTNQIQKERELIAAGAAACECGRLADFVLTQRRTVRVTVRKTPLCTTDLVKKLRETAGQWVKIEEARW